MREIEATFWIEQIKKFLDGYEKHKDPEFLRCTYQRLDKLWATSDDNYRNDYFKKVKS